MDDYFPFGLTFNSYRGENVLENNYLYNSKELENDLNIQWLDFGARMYFPEIGRWDLRDLMAEKYMNISPDVFLLNNPVRFNDLDGMDPTDNTISDQVLKKLNIRTGYGIEVNKKAGTTTITKITYGFKKANSKSSSFYVTQTTFNINADGEVLTVTQSITSYEHLLIQKAMFR